ncbi:coiled-coil domain-containing protein 9 isoform X3 [Engystomops pustulosus]|uniref:coiled-coil domain-containing protein 9 isoform X3 n=1 Tax=Engystomops pustulosus TaxID=76066 RepID=UPI003AFAC2F8
MASVLDVKSKEEKDAELDRKIEALRKKNEALVRRHQMIEEDRKRAELEGIAVTTPRKGKHLDGEPDKARKEKENFSITLDVSAGKKRVINEGKSPKSLQTSPHSETSPRSPTHRTGSRTGHFSGGRSPQGDRHGEQFKDEGDCSHPSERATRGRRSQVPDMPRRSPRIPNEDSPGERWSASPRGAERGGRGPGRGGGIGARGGGHGAMVDAGAGPDRKVKEWEERRKQNIEKMNEEMEKIAEYERSQRDGVREKNPIRNFLDDPRRTGPILEVDRKEGSRRHIRNWGGPDFEKVKTGMDREKESQGRRPGGKNQMDMTMSMTGKERAEYVRWKQEREQIDQERLARHKKPTGQWRREWDAEKTDSMFKEGVTPHVEEEPFGRRDQGKRGAPKPPTMAEFLPESFKRPTQRRTPKRGRAGNKPYSMHDSRWEEDEDHYDEEDEGNLKDRSLPVEEKETCVEKEDVKKVEQSPNQTPEVSSKVADKKEMSKTVEDDDGGDDGEWTDASGDEEEDDYDEGEEEEEEEDSLEAEEEPREESSQASSPPKDQRPPKQVETPKLTIPPPSVNSDEKVVESKPTSPFSPEGHRPVTDWGEEMELLSPPGSSNEDSPPQVPGVRDYKEEAKSQENFSASGCVQNQNPSLDPVKNLIPILESTCAPTTEIKTHTEQSSPERLPGGNLENIDHEESSPTTGENSAVKEESSPSYPPGAVTSLSTPAEGGTSPAEEGTSPAEEGTSPAEERTSPAEEETAPADKETSLALMKETVQAEDTTLQTSGLSDKVDHTTQETSTTAELLEGATKSVHIADFETQKAEVPPSS